MEKEKIVSVGGQVVIEGVMMKSPDGIATAVRRPDGQIVYRKKILSKSNAKLMKIPFIRGVVILLETLFVGTGELTFSANQSGEEEEEDERDGSTGKAEPEITGVSVPENQDPEL